MPPALQLNESSGFLDSPNSLSSFSTPKKLRFFEIADQYRKDTGKWPDTSSICESVGVSMRCFYHHLEIDRKFKSEWEERLLRGEARLTSKLADMSNPIGPLSVLRRYFPDRWSPDRKVTVDINVGQIAQAMNKGEVYEAELVKADEQLPAPPSTVPHAHPPQHDMTSAENERCKKDFRAPE